jgi:hypothetical protein
LGKSTATDEYPTEQQGISNFQVNGNVNVNVSGGKSFGALDNATGDSIYVNVSGKDIKPFAVSVCRCRLPLTWKLEIPCCSVGYSPYSPFPANPS